MREEQALVEFLASSPARLAMLEELHAGEGLTECDLRERLDFSRPTVQRNLDKLLEQGWIRNQGGLYSVTTCGAIVTERFAELVAALETTERLAPFLQRVPRQELDMDVTALSSGELTVAEPGNPLSMVNKHVSQLETSHHGKAVLPFVGLHPYSVSHQRVRSGDLELEVVFSESAAQTVRANPSYAELTREMRETGRFEAFVYSGDIPYYIGVLDDVVQLGADEQGYPRALVETQSERVREWAENRYASYRTSADPLPTE